MSNIVLETIIELINKIIDNNDVKKEEIESIGIAFPGTVSETTVIKAENLGIDDFEVVKKLKKHFYQYGIREGRQASCVFDVNYYLNTNEDLKRCFGDNKISALSHFVNIGIREGRNTSNEFNMKVYRENNSDLKKAFGNNYTDYYLHYISMGHTEGRKSI